MVRATGLQAGLRVVPVQERHSEQPEPEAQFCPGVPLGSGEERVQGLTGACRISPGPQKLRLVFATQQVCCRACDLRQGLFSFIQAAQGQE